MVSQEVLSEAVRAAKAGHRAQARALFGQIVKQDPTCEAAWLWLAELADHPGERVLALEKALALRPDHPVLQRRLELARQEAAARPPVEGSALEEDRPLVIPGYVPKAERAPEEALSTEDRRLEEVREQLRVGRRREALSLLLRLVETQPGNVEAWKLLGELQPTLSERAAALERALALGPHPAALQQDLEQQLAYLKKLQVNPWSAARQFEETGDFDRAAAAYQWIAIHSRLPAERVAAVQRIDQLKLRQASDQITPVNPTLNLLRLAAGPVLLFFFMVLIQAGLNPLAITPLALVSLGGVSAGSVLLTATGMRPLHPAWVQMIGEPGSPGEKETRALLRGLGWLLVIVPFALFFIEAGLRLMKLWIAVVNASR